MFSPEGGCPDGADRLSPLDEYVWWDLGRCVQFILDQIRINRLNLLGVCQGGTFSLCYAALVPQRVANVITMVSPVDFKNLIVTETEKWGKVIRAAHIKAE